MRNQYNKHYRDTEVMQTALKGAEEILVNLRKIPVTTLAYVDQQSFEFINKGHV